jgi:hypothetical protein
VTRDQPQNDDDRNRNANDPKQQRAHVLNSPDVKQLTADAAEWFLARKNAENRALAGIARP